MTPRPGATVRTPRLDRPARRASIVAGAARVFAHGGFAGSSMSAIATEIGVSHLIVYRHFESKDELYGAVLQRALDELTAALVDPRTIGKYGPTTTAFLVAARRDPSGFVVLWRHAAREPEFRSWTDRAERLLAAATEAALVPSVPSRERRWAVRATTSYLVEAVLVWLEDGDPGADDRFVAATDAAVRAGVRSWANSTRRAVG